jgi:hypothetical protein
MRLANKPLRDATNDEIRLFAASFRGGYQFSDEDCEELRNPDCLFRPSNSETIKEAVDDFIRAYEC